VFDKFGIYIISCDNEIVRVGESSSGFARIANGFRQKLRHNRRGRERKNYLAYSWRAEYCSRNLVLDYFPLSPDPFSEDHLRRALEAEITFQFRVTNGAWPRNMSEIHFLERYRCHPSVVAKATEVLQRYSLTYNAAV
jgi:hypothetical protein